MSAPMTSEEDKKAAEEFAFALARNNKTPNPYGCFLAGCEYKKREVVEKVKTIVRGQFDSRYRFHGNYPTDESDGAFDYMIDILDALRDLLKEQA